MFTVRAGTPARLPNASPFLSLYALARMATAKGGCSIPFITPAADGSDHFVVSQDAVAFLAGLGGTPIAPVCVVGKARTGKSFLLNRLVGQPGAFGVGSTVEACTKGVWVWSEPVHVVCAGGIEVAVLFIDTEGIGATGATVDHDARIFSLGALLSSLLVFNSSGPIDEEAVQSLAFVANLTRHVQAQLGGGGERGVAAASALEAEAAALSAGEEVAAGSGHSAHGASQQQGRHRPHSRVVVGKSLKAEPADSDADSGSDDSDDGGYLTNLRREQLKRRAARLRAEAARALAEQRRHPAGASALSDTAAAEPSSFFPSFLWVLRDFSLDLLDDAGQAVTASEYLESCLRQQEGFSSDAQGRNRTRRLLTDFFRERHCATLVRPVEAEAMLQSADDLPEAALRAPFIEQMGALRTLVLEDLVRPKTIQGQFVTGRMLANLAAAYVDAMNHDAVPSIGQAWVDVSRVECKAASDAAAARFAADMEAATPGSSLPTDVDVLTAAHDRARISALDDFDARAVGPSAPKYRSRLKTHMDDALRTLLAQNAAASETASARLVSALWTRFIDPWVSEAAGSSTTATPVARADELAAALSRFEAQYFGAARGPAVYRVFGAFLASQIPGLVREAVAGAASAAEAKAAGLRRECAAAIEGEASARGEVLGLRSERGLLVAERSAAVASAEASALELKQSHAEVLRLRAEVAGLHDGYDAATRAAEESRLRAAEQRLGLRQRSVGSVGAGEGSTQQQLGGVGVAFLRSAAAVDAQAGSITDLRRKPGAWRADFCENREARAEYWGYTLYLCAFCPPTYACPRFGGVTPRRRG